MDYRHVKGSISSSCPKRHQDISRSAVSTWKQKSPLFAWPKSSTHCSVKEGISQSIVPADSFPSCSTAEGVVTHAITEAKAGRAGSLSIINWKTQPVFHRKHKFWGAQVKTKGFDGGAVEPIPCMGERESYLMQQLLLPSNIARGPSVLASYPMSTC